MFNRSKRGARALIAASLLVSAAALIVGVSGWTVHQGNWPGPAHYAPPVPVIPMFNSSTNWQSNWSSVNANGGVNNTVVADTSGYVGGHNAPTFNMGTGQSGWIDIDLGIDQNNWNNGCCANPTTPPSWPPHNYPPHGTPYPTPDPGTGGGGGTPPTMVAICHLTSSSVMPTVSLTVAASAVPAHLGHGDSLGSCP